ncbi:23S rRNA accumulation protein YceD [Aliidiomarina minuta]|uniref:Large ribosomal RNA subunit accumulation protein YceD n=1 Tax=Aliidiomarina minuta TaxID=880057 RepID=A0A432W6D6_9GAMM|nr:23S rRNA accumulation protein YceD [Aliidiomarina minuta]RUO25635.1 23S rRNA accumulation protein YceD [Aliidiomarina minuta]
MQKVRIPVSVDPVKSANKQLSYEGVVPGAGLHRLGDVIVNELQDIQVSLRFDVDEQHTSFFAGHAEAAIEVICQRCNKPMQLELKCEFHYAPLTRRQKEENIPEAYEPVELTELGEVMLHEVVEDELLLAMPIVAKHAAEDCEVDRDAMVFGELSEAEEKPNPFAALQDLKRK